MRRLLVRRRTACVAVLACFAVVASGGAVLAANSAPTAQSRRFYTNGEPIEITLHATDPDGDSLSYTIVQEPLRGTLSGTAPSFLYTPSAGYTGSDSFSWKASDGTAFSNVATVTIRAPVTFRSSSQTSSRADLVTSLIIPRPAGVTSGDVMWLQLSTFGPGTTANLMIDPQVPGWILIRETQVANLVRSRLYKKRAGPAEPVNGYTVTFALPVKATAGIGVWSHADTNWFAINEMTANNAKRVTVPGIWGIEGGRVVGFFGTLGYPVSAPAEMTRRWLSLTTGDTRELRTVSVGADEGRTVTGLTEPRVATSSIAITWIAHLISLRPAA